MTVQKSVEYKRLNGEITELKLNILEDSGNYLIHRDILRHQLSQKQERLQQKLEVKFGVVVENLGSKKERVELGQDQAVLHFGEVVVLFLAQSPKQLA